MNSRTELEQSFNVCLTEFELCHREYHSLPWYAPGRRIFPNSPRTVRIQILPFWAKISSKLAGNCCKYILILQPLLALARFSYPGRIRLHEWRFIPRLSLYKDSADRRPSQLADQSRMVEITMVNGFITRSHEKPSEMTDSIFQGGRSYLLLNHLPDDAWLNRCQSWWTTKLRKVRLRPRAACMLQGPVHS